ncbi:hypothetical protein KQI67_12715 [Bacillus albus]|uniref:Bacterial toxin 50 domain-containing protein n=1 Tax=Bacillus albus TaxID=2026189 RepID=A0A1J9SX19_9BACI|nr:hypothetical protein EJW27_12625 [Bacillus albus]KMP36557.1 hypothetical protein TU52_05735 [Bacillus cereus]MBU5217573.1 hypothetical protein [Bacillus albus]OJD57913.1 hypothetical protein BAU25_19270 [Bacillus albus]RXJ16744.1 hypothetical protein ETJ91_15015 [Bacillus albus]
MFEGISLIGGFNFLTIVAEVGTGGLASPIVIPLDIAATLANGKNKSICYGDNKIAQELLDKFAGKGTTVTKNKERVDFGGPIDKYYDTVIEQYIETNRGMIYYGKDGAHIVPAKPSE